MIEKLLEKLADKIIEKLPQEKSIAKSFSSDYSISREMNTIHDLNYTQEEKEVLRMLQKNLTFKRIVEKCCFALSLTCINTKSQEELSQIKSGVRALEFFMGEIEKNKESVKVNPLTGQPM